MQKLTVQVPLRHVKRSRKNDDFPARAVSSITRWASVHNRAGAFAEHERDSHAHAELGAGLIDRDDPIPLRQI